MDEELAARREPAGHAREQHRVVPHVLEHLDGDDSIEPLRPLRGWIEVVHVGGDDADIPKAAGAGAAFDKGPLRSRIGHRKNLRVREALRHVERQRSPSASELENVLAVGDLRPFAGERKHRVLGALERTRRILRLVPQRAAVFHPRTEHQLEECRGHLVVLRVGRARVHRDRRRPQLRDEPFQLEALPRLVALVFLAEALTQNLPDARANQRIGQQIAFEDRVAQAHAARLGNHGTNALVVC